MSDFAKSILQTEMEHSGTGVLDYKSITNRIVEVMDRHEFLE